MSAKKRRARVCEVKTARGNVYATKGVARRTAREVARKSRLRIVAYRCRVCEAWHIGKGNSGANRWDQTRTPCDG